MNNIVECFYLVSKHLMDIVIKAIDQTKDVAQKVENNFKRVGTSAFRNINI